MQKSILFLLLPFFLFFCSFFFFPFSFYLLLISLISFFLSLFFIGKKDVITFKKWSIPIHSYRAGLFAIFALFSIYTLKNYFNPSFQSNTFNNVHQSALTHHGFEFNDVITFSSSNNLNDALFPQLGGDIQLKKKVKADSSFLFTLNSLGNELPIYISQKGSGNSSEYKLSNFNSEFDLSKGFTLQIGDNHTYKVQPVENKSILATMSLGWLDYKYPKYQIEYYSPSNTIIDTASYSINIQYGVTLKDFILSAENIPLPEDLDSLFEKSYLLRKEVFRDTDHPRYDLDEMPPLVLFPSVDLRNTANVSLSTPDQSASSEFGKFSQNMTINSAITFYVGFQQQGGRNGLVFKLKGGKPYAANATRDTLQFEFPKYYALDTEADLNKSFFINSDTKDILNRDYNSGFYLNFNPDESFKNHVRSSFGYIPGLSKQQMHYLVSDHNNLKNSSLEEPVAENTMFRLYGKKKSSFNWLFEFKNFKSSFSYSTQKLLLFLWIVSVLSFLLLYASQHYLSQRRTFRYFNILFVVLSLLLFIVGFRYFLSWRIGVFPPLENISIKEFNNLRLASGIKNTNLGLVLLYMFFGLQLYFNTSSADPGYKNSFRLTQFFNFRGFNFSGTGNIKGMFFSAAIIIILTLFFAQFFNGLPGLVFAILYFLFANLRLSQRIQFQLSKNGEDLTLEQDAKVRDVFIRKGFLFIATLLAIFTIDKGFTIILFFLGAFYICVERYLFGQKYGTKGKKHLFFTRYGLFVAIVCLLLLPLAKPIIKGLTASGVTELSWVPNHFDFRAKIFSNGLKDVVQNTDFGNSDKIHLLRAAHNKWFIQNYYWAQEDQNLLSNYFKLQPHSNRGVPFITQTSDLVSLRYIISEHSEIFLLTLIFFLIGLLWVFLEYFNSKNAFHLAFIGIWYFLVIRSIFVWMTVTNKIVFFGQDFPFFSINSRLIFWFTLFLLGLLPLFYSEGDAKANLTKNKKSNRNKLSKKVNALETVNGSTKLYWLPISLAMVVLFLFGADRFFEIYNSKSKAKSSFNISPNLQAVKNKLVDLNSEFSGFQKESYPDGLGNKLSPSQLVVNFYDTKMKDDGSYLYSIFNKDMEDRFSSSVLLNFFGSSGDKTSLNNLVYVYKSNNGEYRLKLRSDFFTIPSIQAKQNSWKGSILSAPVYSEYTFILNDSLSNKELNWKEVIPNINLVSSNRSKTNVKAVSYPSTWTKTKKPMLFFWSTQVPTRESHSDFSISNGIFSYSALKDDNFGLENFNYPLALSPLDYINATETKNNSSGNSVYENVRYEIVSDKDQYLAKNIWLNGKKNKFIYPMSYKNIWAYHIAELAKSKLSNNPELEDKDIPTTIDFNLHNKVFNEVHKHNMPHNFSLVALDGDSKVRLLFDYKKSVHDADNKLDPNKESDFYKVLASYERVNNTLEERDLFGNLCLLKMSPGPGSSFKPFTFSSVISGYKFPWNSMTTAQPSSETFKSITKRSKEDKIQITKYAGHSIQSWTNFGPNDIISSKQFLSNSSNYYNSLLMFAGSYRQDIWSKTHDYIRSSSQNKRDTFSFLVNTRAASDYKVEERFPIMQVGSKRYYFDKDKWPRDNSVSAFIEKNGKLFSDEEAILPKYLSENYTFSIKPGIIQGDKRRNGDLFRGKYDLYENSTGHKLWAYPEASTFIQMSRNGSGSFDYMSAGGRGLRQPTVGGDPLITTPLKMAENSLRLFTLDKSKNASILNDSLKVSAVLFNYDKDSYKSEVDYFNTIKSNIYVGMYRTLSDGTAKDIIGSNSTKAYNYAINNRGYHVYAKTGTLGVAGKKNDLKALTVIICKEAVHSPSFKFEDLSKNKVYSLYFTFYSSPNDEWEDWMIEIVRNSLDHVLKSKTFKTYWNEN